MMSDPKKGWFSSKEQEFNKDAPILHKDADPQAFMRWKRVTMGYTNTMFGISHILETLTEVNIEKFIAKQHLKFQDLGRDKAEDATSIGKQSTASIILTKEPASRSGGGNRDGAGSQDLEGENGNSEKESMPDLNEEDELDQAMRNGYAQGLKAAAKKSQYMVIPPTGSTVPFQSEDDPYTRLVLAQVREDEQSEDFIKEVARRVIQERVQYDRLYQDAKCKTTVGMFVSPRTVDSDLIRRMEERTGQSGQIQRWINEGNLVNLLKCLSDVINHNRLYFVHEDLRTEIYWMDFIFSTSWNPSKTTLAAYLQKFEASVEAQESRGIRITSQTMQIIVLKQLFPLREFAEFIKPWFYEAKPLPEDGYPQLKSLLLRFMETHKISNDYGFGGKPRSSVKDSDGTPAITATAMPNGKSGAKSSNTSGGGRVQQASKIKYPKVCTTCGAIGHMYRECSSKLDKPPTLEMKAKWADIFAKECKRIGVDPSNHMTYQRWSPQFKKNKDFGNLKSAATMSSTNIDRDPSSSQLKGLSSHTIFVPVKPMFNHLGVIHNTQKQEAANTEFLRSPAGKRVPTKSLMMWDNGANINVYLTGSRLDMIDIRQLRSALQATTAAGEAVLNTIGDCPTVGDWFAHTTHAPCCILAEGRAAANGWRVCYETNSTSDSPLVPRFVDVTIKGITVRFERYSNQLLYIDLKTFNDAFQLSHFEDKVNDGDLDRSTVLVTTRQQAGRDVGKSYAHLAKGTRSSMGRSAAATRSPVNQEPTNQQSDAQPEPTAVSAFPDPFSNSTENEDGDVDSHINETTLERHVHWAPQDSAPPSAIGDRPASIQDLGEVQNPDDQNGFSGPTSNSPEVVTAAETADEVILDDFDDDELLAGPSPNLPPERQLLDIDDPLVWPVGDDSYKTRGTAAGYAKAVLSKDLAKLCTTVYELHLALGCIPYEDLANMVEMGKLGDTALTKKLILLAARTLPPCDRCTAGKIKARHAKTSHFTPGLENLLDGGKHNLRIDIMFTRRGKKGKSPVLVVTDELSAFTNISYLAGRSTKEIEAALSKMITFLTKHGIDVGRISSDREGAFVELGKGKYRFQYTAGPGTHEAIAEATIRALKEIFICKREGLSFTLPLSLYPKLMEHACILKNVRLHRGATATPMEMITGKKYSADDLIQGAFGRIGLFKIPDEEVKKRKLDDLDPKSEYGVVVGFEPAYPRNLKVYLPATRQIVTRRGGQAVGNPQPVIDMMNAIAAEDLASNSQSSNSTQDTQDDSSEYYTVNTTYRFQLLVEPPDQLPVINQLAGPDASTGASGTMPHPGTRTVVLDPSDPQEYYVPTSAFERMSLKQAQKYLPSTLIEDAVINELVTNMQRHGVFAYCSPTQVRREHILRSLLFLKIKTKPNGDFDKLKARLASDGSTQTADEYTRSAAPTVDMASVALILSLVKYFGASVATVDVPAAYLHAPLKEDVYMRLKPDVASILLAHDPSLQQYMNSDGSFVVKLLKCLYGLKQSGAEWHTLLVEFLHSLGYTQSQADRCVFYKHNNGKLDILTIHVDDLLFLYTNQTDFDKIKEQFIERFGPMTFTEGKAHNYLGMSLEILPDNSVFVSQIGYIRGLITAYSQWRGDLTPSFKLRAYKTPSVDSLTDLKPASYADKIFRENVIHFVYSLMYLSQRTRPDILFTTTFMTTLVSCPPKDIIIHLDRLFGYLENSTNRGLLFGAESTGLTLFADAAYAIHKDGKSHSGVLINMGKGKSPILSQSLKQRLVTLSSTEAELDALVNGLKRLQPIRRLLEEFHLLESEATKVMQDNKSTITIASSGEGYAGKSKHMRVRYHAIAEQIALGEIELTHCPTIKMLADLLTKPGGGSHFPDLIEAITSILPDN